MKFNISYLANFLLPYTLLIHPTSAKAGGFDDLLSDTLMPAFASGYQQAVLLHPLFPPPPEEQLFEDFVQVPMLSDDLPEEPQPPLSLEIEASLNWPAYSLHGEDAPLELAPTMKIEDNPEESPNPFYRERKRKRVKSKDRDPSDREAIDRLEQEREFNRRAAKKHREKIRLDSENQTQRQQVLDKQNQILKEEIELLRHAKALLLSVIKEKNRRQPHL